MRVAAGWQMTPGCDGDCVVQAGVVHASKPCRAVQPQTILGTSDVFIAPTDSSTSGSRLNPTETSHLLRVTQDLGHQQDDGW